MKKALVEVNKSKFSFPNLIDEGKKYGLSNSQLHQLKRYLDDKRMLRLISLGKFKEDAKAWLSALTGIVANILETDAHIAIWLDKKLEGPRNWVLSKLNAVIPTQIDDIAVKAIQVASEIRDNTILPTEEKIFSKINDKMHTKYDFHNEASHLGNNMKELKQIAKDNLSASKQEADQDALKVLKQRKLQDHILHGYYDKDGDFINLSKYNKNTAYRILKSTQTQGGTRGNAKQENKNTTSEGTKQEGKYP